MQRLQGAIDGSETFASVAQALGRTERACRKKALDMSKRNKRRRVTKSTRAPRQGWSDVENEKLRALYAQHTVLINDTGRRQTDYGQIALAFADEGRSESALRRQASILNLSSVKWLPEEIALFHALVGEGKSVDEVATALNALPCNTERKMVRKGEACRAKARLIGLL